MYLKKEDAAVDYFGKQPDILSRACVTENIARGYVDVGFLDSTLRLMPSFQKLLATCRRIIAPEEYELCLSSFYGLMAYSYYQGLLCYIPDEVFIKYGFPVDIDAYGNEKLCVAGISKENEQRAKVLTAAAEIASRAKRNEEIELELKRKADQANAKVDQKRSEDQAVVDELCSLVGRPSSEDNLQHCQLQHFAKLKAPKLRAFIAARHLQHRTPTSVKHLKKPHTALADALEGRENAVSVAFDIRTNKSRLLAAAAAAEVSNNSAANVAPPMPLVSCVLLYPMDGGMKPSDILSDNSKIDAICSIFDPQDHLKKVDFKIRPLTSDVSLLVAKADVLFDHLQTRLLTHVKLRVKPSQRSHWCLQWARKNLAVVAAYMVWANHLKKDISCLSQTKCLLAKAGDNFLCCTNIDATHLGCYLHYNTNEEMWVRSGSATGEGGFAKRLMQHEKRAKDHRNDDESRFYDLFPHSDSNRSSNPHKDGLFEYLTPYIGASFSRDAATPVAFSTDYGDGGIFFYTEEEKGRVSRANFSGKNGEQKFKQMVAYLFELGYDLALSFRHNVSKSPGFEGCGLIFDKKKKK